MLLHKEGVRGRRRSGTYPAPLSQRTCLHCREARRGQGGTRAHFSGSPKGRSSSSLPPLHLGCAWHRLCSEVFTTSTASPSVPLSTVLFPGVVLKAGEGQSVEVQATWHQEHRAGDLQERRVPVLALLLSGQGNCPSGRYGQTTFKANL